MTAPIAQPLPSFPEPRLPRRRDLPILVEDDHEVEMGESNPHFVNDDILHNGLKAHLAGRPLHYVYSNMDLHYHPDEPAAYKTPDTMVVVPSEPLPEDLASYRIGKHGPSPILVAEVLSKRTANRGDLKIKVTLYADLNIAEYLLIDPSGQHLPQRLLLKRLRPDGTWEDLQDADGGVTSILGFRVIFDADGRLRVLDAKTGRPFARPDEAEMEAEKRRVAEERIRELEAELERLRRVRENGGQKNGPGS